MPFILLSASRYFKTLLVIACCIVAFSLAVDGRLSASELESDFRRDAPVAWRKLEDRVMKSKFHIDVEFDRTEQGETPENAKLDFNASTSIFRCVRTFGKDESEQVFSCNSSYSFVTDRAAQRSARVTRLANKSDITADSIRFQSEVFAPYNIQVFALLDVAKHATFQVTKVDRKQHEAGSVALIMFTCYIRSDRGPILTGGSLELLPDREWAPLRYEAQVSYHDGSAIVVGSSHFDDESIRHGLPRRFDFRSTDPQSQATLRHYVVNYTDFADGDLKDEDARLSAWGFPEPEMYDDASVTQRRWLIWSNLAGIFLICVGLWVRRLVVRRRAASGT